jgi:hypothetical protein
MQYNTIINADCLLAMREMESCSIDIIFGDAPYNLGSEIMINEQGKPMMKKSSDFMNRWEAPNGDWWEQFYKEAFRILKYSGHCLLFSIDRQQLIPLYYSQLAGFTTKQAIYWYFISNFPKASDLSKMLDSQAGMEREITREAKGIYRQNNINNFDQRNSSDREKRDIPASDLAKKYNGLKYSIAPLKQTCEIVNIFQKPYKTGSCLHDVLALENGDSECTCGALDIENNRVPTSDADKKEQLRANTKGSGRFNETNCNAYNIKPSFKEHDSSQGRYPSQLFCDSESAKILDEQSGVEKSGQIKVNHNRGDKEGNLCNPNGIYGKFKANKTETPDNYSDIGGCSKILHKCDFDDEDFDLLMYCPKVSKSEREEGCGKLEESEIAYSEFRKNVEITNNSVAKYPDGSPRPMNKSHNNHLTLKPISLCQRILKLFKTPNKQVIFFPFAGVFSEVIGGWKAGFRDFYGCEINSDYIRIGKARFKHHCQKELF